MSALCGSLRVNVVLEGGLRLSQLSALSLLEMSSSESLDVENGELLSTSSYRLLRLRDEPASMEIRCLVNQSIGSLVSSCSCLRSILVISYLVPSSFISITPPSLPLSAPHLT